MATYTLDQKGRLLTTVFPALRGDGAIGGSEILEVTVDLSQIGSGSTQGQPSGFPNSGNGFAAADIFEVAVLPKNSQILAVQVLLDTGATTPDAILVGTGGTLTVGTVNIGDTGSATRFDSARSLLAAANALAYTTGTQFYTADDKLRVALVTLTGATYTKVGRFRIRVHMVCYNT